MTIDPQLPNDELAKAALNKAHEFRRCDNLEAAAVWAQIAQAHATLALCDAVGES